MLSKIKKCILPFYFISLVVALMLLVATTLSTKWVIIETREEIHLGNLTKYFGGNKNDEKFDLCKTFTFGMKSFCLEIYYEQLKTTERECKSISIFKQDSEKDALEDALKLQILSIALASLTIVTIFMMTCCHEGPVRKVVIYSTISLLVFSGMCLICCAIMIKTTLTPESSIVRNNIMAHVGHAQVNLQGIRSGAAYNIAAAAFTFLVVSLGLFVYKYIIQKKNESKNEQLSNYRLLLSQQ